MYSFLSHTTTASPLSAGFMTMSSFFWRAVDLLGVRLDLFDGMVAYFSQALVDIAPNIEECTMPRFSVDGSLKQGSENIIVRISFDVLEDGQRLPSVSKSGRKR